MDDAPKGRVDNLLRDNNPGIHLYVIYIISLVQARCKKKSRMLVQLCIYTVMYLNVTLVKEGKSETSILSCSIEVNTHPHDRVSYVFRLHNLWVCIMQANSTWLRA